jgi:hypothetical protein
MTHPGTDVVLTAADEAWGALHRLRDRVTGIPQPGSLAAARITSGCLEETMRAFAAVLRTEAALAGAAAAGEARRALAAAAQDAGNAELHLGQARRHVEELAAEDRNPVPARVARLAREALNAMSALAAALTPVGQREPCSTPGLAAPGGHRQFAAALRESADRACDICSALSRSDILAAAEAPAARSAVAELRHAGAMMTSAMQRLQTAGTALAGGTRT